MFKSKWWIFILLAAFTFVLAPKDIWHHCEKPLLHSKSDQHSKVFTAHNDCPICDFHFYVGTIHTFPEFHFSKQYFSAYSETAISEAYDFKNPSASRGPPVMNF